MSKSVPPIARVRPPESVYSQQLERGFPYLIFAEPLEREFRGAYHRQMLRQLRINLWLAMAFMVAFSVLSHTLLKTGEILTITLIEALVLAPLLIGALTLVHVPQSERLYPRVAQFGAPIFGIGVAAVEIIAWQQGVSLISMLVIATIFMYLMTGLLFYAAVRTGLIVFAAYLGMAIYAGVEGVELASNTIALFLANVMGATVCYTLERANRTNYLESCLLIDVASRDGLTGINNRRAFDEHITKIWQQAARDRASLALLLLDIDHFKAFNDYYGHQAGDECLKQVAWVLAHSARRPLDITARYGGEEFAIVLYDARRSHVEEVCRQIQAAIDELNVPHAAAPTRRVTVSIGAACVEPVAERSHFGFIQLADEALYEAKGRGRNCVVILDQEYHELSTGSFRKKTRARAGS